jgi:dCTP deaminase
MGILSKKGIVKRIIFGEQLIYKWLLQQGELDAEIKTLKDLLDEYIEETDENEKEKKLGKYFGKIGLNNKIVKIRRTAIREIVGKFFLNREKDEIHKEIEKFVKFRENEAKPKIPLPIFIDSPDYNCLKGANYDLRLGEDVYVTTEKVPKKLTAMGADGVVSIEPGEFGILMAHEYIFVPPDLMGFISIRLTFKQKGLVNISGFHVDPGFHGRLMFAVFNSGPNDVPLRYNERVFMIMFSELTEWAKVKESAWHGMETIPIETMFGLRGTSISVRNLDERVKRLELLFPVVLTGIVSVVVAVIAWVLTHWL